MGCGHRSLYKNNFHFKNLFTCPAERCENTAYTQYALISKHCRQAIKPANSIILQQTVSV